LHEGVLLGRIAWREKGLGSEDCAHGGKRILYIASDIVLSEVHIGAVHVREVA
jgi:hypothetical protein